MEKIGEGVPPVKPVLRIYPDRRRKEPLMTPDKKGKREIDPVAPKDPNLGSNIDVKI